MKKVLFFFFILTIAVFSQSKFAIEAGGGIDLVLENNYSNSYDNGFSLLISPVYKLNKTISFMASFAYHRVEGYTGYYFVTPQIFPNYSIDNPYKPNIKTYDFSVGMRANFSEKQVTPYFVFKTGLLFTDYPDYYYGLEPYPILLNFNQRHDQRIAYYFSPGLGVNFRLVDKFNILIEGRFLIKTGNDYSYLPLTTSLVYNF